MSMTTLAHGIGKGLLAGVVGTAAMTLSNTIEMRVRNPQASNAPAEAAKKVLGIEEFQSDAAEERFSNPVHWGYGTAWGALRGLLGPPGLARDPPALHTSLPCGAAHWCCFRPSTWRRQSPCGAAERSRSTCGITRFTWRPPDSLTSGSTVATDRSAPCTAPRGHEEPDAGTLGESGKANFADIVPSARATGEKTLGPKCTARAGPLAGAADDGVDLTEVAAATGTQNDRVLGARCPATLGLDHAVAGDHSARGI
jgi:hypothetical protein